MIDNHPMAHFILVCRASIGSIFGSILEGLVLLQAVVPTKQKNAVAFRDLKGEQRGHDTSPPKEIFLFAPQLNPSLL